MPEKGAVGGLGAREDEGVSEEMSGCDGACEFCEEVVTASGIYIGVALAAAARVTLRAAEEEAAAGDKEEEEEAIRFLMRSIRACRFDTMSCI